MSLTLTDTLAADGREATITGEVPAGIGAGFRFRLDDELLGLRGFRQHRHQPGDDPAIASDRDVWRVDRGLGDSLPAEHTATTEILAVDDAWATGTDATPPGPFLAVSDPGLVAALAALPRTIRKDFVLADFMDDGHGNGVAVVCDLPSGAFVGNGAIFCTETFDDSTLGSFIQCGDLSQTAINSGSAWDQTSKTFGNQTQVIGNQLNDGGVPSWVDRILVLPGGVTFGVYLQGWANDEVVTAPATSL